MLILSGCDMYMHQATIGEQTNFTCNGRIIHKIIHVD